MLNDRHNNPLIAQEVVNTGAINTIATCLVSKENELVRVSVMTLSEISKHNSELATKVINTPKVLNSLMQCMSHNDWEIRQQACTCIANIAKHTNELAQRIADADIHPKLISCIKDEKNVQRQAVLCAKEISCHNLELARMACEKYGLLPFVIDYLNNSKGGKLHGATMLGYVAGFDNELAKVVVKEGGHISLISVLNEEPEDFVKAAAAWSLGQIGKHSHELSKSLVDQNVLTDLIRIYKEPTGAEVLKKKVKRSLKLIIQQCIIIERLMELIECDNGKIMIHILSQIVSVLKADTEEKKQFLEKGYLEKIKEIKIEDTSKLKTIIDEFTDLYPPPPVEEPEVKEEPPVEEEKKEEEPEVKEQKVDKKAKKK